MPWQNIGDQCAIERGQQVKGPGKKTMPLVKLGPQPRKKKRVR